MLGGWVRGWYEGDSCCFFRMVFIVFFWVVDVREKDGYSRFYFGGGVIIWLAFIEW